MLRFPDNVIVEPDALRAWKAGDRDRIEIGFVLQSDEQILNLGGPVLGEPHLDTAAYRPAPMPMLVRNLAGRPGKIVLDLRERATGGCVNHPVAWRISQPAAVG